MDECLDDVRWLLNWTKWTLFALSDSSSVMGSGCCPPKWSNPTHPYYVHENDFDVGSSLIGSTDDMDNPFQ